MTKMLDHDVEGPLAWTGAELPDDAGLITLDEDCLDELLALAKELTANPLPVLSLHPDDFDLPACRAMMTDVSNQLDHGHGFVIIDRLPLERLDGEIADKLYWLLAAMVARPVAQSWDGKMLYDVRDQGKPPGNGVRPDITNVGQNLHTDNSYNLCPPDYVALFCRQTAMRGGISQVVSFYAAHNRMRAEAPELLARLYQDVTFDRQREHAPDDVMTTEHPMFAWDGQRLLGRLSKRQVEGGYALAGVEMDNITAAALETFEAIMMAPGMRKEFQFQPGQIQIVNNRTCGHARTAFTDWPETERRRHLIRLWLRHQGRAFYNG
ncbi:MAG: TauD/TfdA family dioxygenase [Alphaproteobacteria bacterium]|jgi:alpha-ketoglutarate-dependent taurine dioxygenase|nr:TauD/TfdA family dioxygenase [Alphaproteobacteria bacterium]